MVSRMSFLWFEFFFSLSHGFAVEAASRDAQGRDHIANHGGGGEKRRQAGWRGLRVQGLSI